MSPAAPLPASHPRCPDCGFDLVAQLRSGRATCPECGGSFETHELKHEPRPGDWTLGRGLRRVAATLALRWTLWTPAWGLLLWIGTALPAWLGPSLPGPLATTLRLVLGLAVMAGGGVVGVAFARGIEERAGLSSPVLVVIVVAAAWSSLLVGAIAVRMLAPGASLQTVLALPVAGALALYVIVKAMVLDEL